VLSKAASIGARAREACWERLAQLRGPDLLALCLHGVQQCGLVRLIMERAMRGARH
jgi:hypothetical protein